jgi:hypothetical protein
MTPGSHRDPGSSTMGEDGDHNAAAIPRVDTTLSVGDHLGAWRVRWGIGRADYRVEPGLYAVGNPSDQSDVFVTANYKMSFDRLRSQLGGRDAWIMVLDTKGINVWCAAGKGTFGTQEIIDRVAQTQLRAVVSHRTLVLPQLGAPGVAAHEVKRQTGFTVVYGPVRAEDLPAFLDAGMKATPEMRRVRFTLRDRVVLTPIELVGSAKHALLIVAAMIVLGGLGTAGYSLRRVATVGLSSAALFCCAYLAGAVLAPALLPWLPGRVFAAKGAWAGLLAFAAAGGIAVWVDARVLDGGLAVAAWVLIFVAVASFMAMNFTGASTYTSLSGVLREVRIAGRAQAVCAVAGLVLWVAALFV